MHHGSTCTRIGLIASWLLTVCPRSEGQLPSKTPTAAEAAHDARMAWWREARFGMFIHWGLYALHGRGEWVMFNERIPASQ